MELFQELFQQCLAEGEFDVTRIRYAVVDGRGGYFQNVKKIAEFSTSRILLRGKKGAICVEGEGLSLGRYFGGDAVILGNIFKVAREE